MQEAHKLLPNTKTFDCLHTLDEIILGHMEDTFHPFLTKTNDELKKTTKPLQVPKDTYYSLDQRINVVHDFSPYLLLRVTTM